MRKKFGFVLAMILAVCTFGFVSGWHIHWIPTENNTYDIGSEELKVRKIEVYDIDIADDLAVDDDASVGGDLTVTGSVTINSVTLAQNKTLRLPLMSFVISDANGVVIGPITASTAPGLEYDNKSASLVWGNAELSYASVTFTVPEDYASGGAFRILADESADGNSPCAVDFNVYNKAPGSAWDTATTNQSIVLLTEAAGTPELMSLAVTTDFAALAAGDIVVLEIWRENATQDTASDFEVYEVYFTYD